MINNNKPGADKKGKERNGAISPHQGRRVEDDQSPGYSSPHAQPHLLQAETGRT